MKILLLKNKILILEEYFVLLECLIIYRILIYFEELVLLSLQIKSMML